jgi:LysM repeat protein
VVEYFTSFKEPGMAYKTIGIEIDEATYQRAVAKALSQNKTINQVVAELVNYFAGPAPAPVHTAPPVQTTFAPQTTYFVQSGDSLGAIARKVYGDATLYPRIQQANNITDPRRIWVGQALIIPALTSNGASTTTVTPTPVRTPVAPQPTTPVAIGGDAVARNPMPPAQFVGSPNYNRRPRGEISAIVMHATANSTLQGVINWFNNPQAQASAHYTIDKDGTIAQHVQDAQRAWHAGVSTWLGRDNLNDWSIGIELVNLNNGVDPFPEAQYQANLNLVAHLLAKYNIQPALIVAHYDVSPNRKTDPKGFDMDRLRREAAARVA